ncbi:unnamed protein product [Prorocentrum cordatum]|uniref:Uncharacterized protein n=1 Tax=Prorocentrum cordatum TaxID=2364126 RepID=A0ABN9VG36_9DINO|nr:unnamed protein product [Polarella glacialis]
MRGEEGFRRAPCKSAPWLASALALSLTSPKAASLRGERRERREDMAPSRQSAPSARLLTRPHRSPRQVVAVRSARAEEEDEEEEEEDEEEERRGGGRGCSLSQGPTAQDPCLSF